MTPDDTISITEGARLADVAPRTMRRWINDGVIKGYRIGPRLLRVSAADVEKLLAPVSPQ